MQLDQARLAYRYRQPAAVSTTIDDAPPRALEPSSPAGRRQLRGTPVIARGVSGAIAGTDPTSILDDWCGCGRRKQRDRLACKPCSRRA